MKRNRTRKYITEREFNQLINNIENPLRNSPKLITRKKAILCLLFYHALRRAELCSMKWSCIDLQDRTMQVFRNKGGKFSVHPIYDLEYTILKELKKSSDSKYVICSPTKERISNEAIDKFFYRINNKKIIDFQVHAHSLRHGCGFYLANKGIDTRSIQVYLGHTDIRYTEMYTEIAPCRFKNFF